MIAKSDINFISCHIMALGFPVQFFVDRVSTETDPGWNQRQKGKQMPHCLYHKRNFSSLDTTKQFCLFHFLRNGWAIRRGWGFELWQKNHARLAHVKSGNQL